MAKIYYGLIPPWGQCRTCGCMVWEEISGIEYGNSVTMLKAEETDSTTCFDPGDYVYFNDVKFNRFYEFKIYNHPEVLSIERV